MSYSIVVEYKWLVLRHVASFSCHQSDIHIREPIGLEVKGQLRFWLDPAVGLRLSNSYYIFQNSKEWIEADSNWVWNTKMDDQANMKSLLSKLHAKVND